jgi:uncharacterized protein (DUF488 family)
VPLYTVGHGTLPADAFAALLNGAGIVAIVDVRSVPKSRHNPQFTGEAMAEWLPQAGVAYSAEPRLGGFRRPRADSPNVALRHPSFRGYADYMLTTDFVAARDGVLQRAGTEPLAIVCSESVWWRCHRRLIADSAVLVANTPVLHLMHDGHLHPHRPTEGVRTAGDHLVYDAGQTPLFPENGDAGTGPS